MGAPGLVLGRGEGRSGTEWNVFAGCLIVWVGKDESRQQIVWGPIEVMNFFFNGNETNTRARGGTQRKPSIIHDMARHIDFLTTT